MDQTLSSGSKTARTSSFTTSPPTKKNGQLKRGVFHIPLSQKELFDMDLCWIENIRAQGHGTSVVPSSVLREVRSSALKSAAAASNISEKAPSGTTASPPATPASKDKMSTETITRTPAAALREPSETLSAKRHQSAIADTRSPKVQISRTEAPHDSDSSPQQPDIPLPSIEVPTTGLLEKRVPAFSQMEASQSLAKTSSNREEPLLSQEPPRPFSPSWSSEADSSDVEDQDTPISAKQARQPESLTRGHVLAPLENSALNLRSSSPPEELDVEVPDALGGKNLHTQASERQSSREHSRSQPKEGGQIESPLLSRHQQRQNYHYVNSPSSPSDSLIPNNHKNTTLHEELQEHGQEVSQTIQHERRRRLMKEPVFPELGGHREVVVSAGPNSSNFGSIVKRRRSTGIHPSEASRDCVTDVAIGRVPVLRSGTKTYVARRTEHRKSAPANFMDHLEVVAMAHTNKPSRGFSMGTGANPIYTWKLPYETFKSAYPDFMGDLEDFLRACFCIQGFASTGSLASFLYDDVIRAYVDFIGYVHAVKSGKTMNLLEWYNRNVDALQYSKKVVTTENVASILAAYPKKVDVIRQIVHSSQDFDPVRREAVPTLEPERTDGSEHAQMVPNDLMERVARQELSLPSTTLAPLAESDCASDSLWPHGQLSSPQMNASLFGPSALSDDTGKDQSQDLYQSQRQSQPNHHIQNSSSGLGVTESPLALPSSLAPTAAIPLGMDRVSYMLQSPAWRSLADVSPPRQSTERRTREKSAEMIVESAIRRPTREPVVQSVQQAPADGTTSRKRSREGDDLGYNAQTKKRHTSGVLPNNALSNPKIAEQKRREQDSEDDWFEPPQHRPPAAKAVESSVQPQPARTEHRQDTVVTSNMQTTEASSRRSPALLKLAAPLPKKQRQPVQALPLSDADRARRFGEFLKSKVRAKKGSGQRTT
ncbi:hypothetical protein CMQ_7968 [Grosmannia clavigera kw1407]|uniref:Uncharacterized protein n=1 Tax=Grosmannia clavigera (strain kw1407 / UAMH 11150) TaxID=655863 RepID=F0XSA1_GROCL|nr:uncharacterized protein CMQ_7968 [Grosmannia clavigera kw1407]EFW99600.1 hypothetical protein CMQ_7968 [Grosmannia clavigera kw1407]